MDSKRVSSFSIILIFTCLSLAGIFFIPLLPIKLSPTLSLPEINISFTMPNNSARIIEMEVTSKLEAMLSRMKNIERIQSTSSNGRGEISIRMNKHADIDIARFEVSTIVRQTWPSLPPETGYPLISVRRPEENADRPFMSYTINSPANPILIQEYTESQISPRLSQIEGVSRIDVYGAQPMEWQLTYDNMQLQQLGVAPGEIQAAVQRYLDRIFLGIASIETSQGEKQWLRVTVSPPLTPQRMEGNNVTGQGNNDAGIFDISNIQVKNVNGKVVSLNELVTVAHVERRPVSYYRINGLNSIYLSITADENANQLELSNKIKNQLAELATFFPAGYETHLAYDATEYINTELQKVYFRSSLTLVILLLFVLVIYRNLRYLLMISISLAVNLAIALIFYYFMRLEIQLYSLAGITISLTLVIDNTIVMSDQMIQRLNMKAFVAILTATLTSIGALSIIFFLDEKIRLNLQDFAYVIIINLAISLFVALFLVPALLEKLDIKKRVQGSKFKVQSSKFKVQSSKFKVQRFRPRISRINTNKRFYYSIIQLFSDSVIRFRGNRKKVYFNRFYEKFCIFTYRWRAVMIILLILAFGLPVFLLPDKLEIEPEEKADAKQWKELYNKSLGSTFYKEKMKPIVDVALGGSLRLFIQKVYTGSYFVNREETSLSVTATLPNGATIEQMNVLIQKMEQYISNYKEVKQFQTQIFSARQANINILFTKEALRSGFPYMLKSNITSRALTIGGGSWGVYGFGQGFSNDVRESVGSYQVEMFGFNYDELNERAERFKELLLENRRIKEVTINSEFSWYKDDYVEFGFNLDKEQLARRNMLPIELFTSLRAMFGQQLFAGQTIGDFGMERIYLQSKQSKEYDIWNLLYGWGAVNEKNYKLSEFAEIEKQQTPQNIVKIDQQYRLCLQYEYIGAGEQGRKILDNNIKAYRKVLPMGYTIESANRMWYWRDSNNSQYALLALIFVIIYFTCSVLFNSMKQPFSILSVVPISYIGIFLTFYLFKLNFDQGGFAAFVLLCALTINANIYVIDEYNNIRAANPKRPPMKIFLKAWNAKVSPIFLTIISTILGFIPFMLGEQKEAFWFALAAGTIGGLLISFVGIFCFLPLFMRIGKKR
ncbi:MAG: efflux RND transporter permease subunit [Tannerella sp.]|jgi:multidrug efflux pump subunit AcrB|nr:efflux RND transporter permease subunit [Tannerella sp.]